MTRRQAAPIGAPCRIDLKTPDRQTAHRFYGALFGWAAQAPTGRAGDYDAFSLDGVPMAACTSNPPGSPTVGSWAISLACEDAGETVRLAGAHGGQVLVPATDVGDLGVMAQVRDPGGATVGLWEPRDHAGFGSYGEPGNPTWFELHTRSHSSTVSFYRDVFRWDTQTVSDTDDFRLTTMGVGDERLAGIMDATGYLAADLPSYWEVYFAVADTDRSVRQVTSLGGSILGEARDTPFGRLAAVADPTGARFTLVGQA